MNELDAIQEQMAWLGIDVGWQQWMPIDAYGMWGYDMWGSDELTDEELAMFQPGWEFGEPVEEAAPWDMPADVMPEYDMEELKIDISPMLSWLPKDALADLIIWIGQERTNLNSNNEAENA